MFLRICPITHTLQYPYLHSFDPHRESLLVFFCWVHSFRCVFMFIFLDAFRFDKLMACLQINSQNDCNQNRRKRYSVHQLPHMHKENSFNAFKRFAIISTFIFMFVNPEEKSQKGKTGFVFLCFWNAVRFHEAKFIYLDCVCMCVYDAFMGVCSMHTIISRMDCNVFLLHWQKYCKWNCRLKKATKVLGWWQRKRRRFFVTTVVMVAVATNMQKNMKEKNGNEPRENTTLSNIKIITPTTNNVRDNSNLFRYKWRNMNIQRYGIIATHAHTMALLVQQRSLYSCE